MPQPTPHHDEWPPVREVEKSLVQSFLKVGIPLRLDDPVHAGSTDIPPFPFVLTQDLPDGGKNLSQRLRCDLYAEDVYGLKPAGILDHCYFPCRFYYIIIF